MSELDSTKAFDGIWRCWTLIGGNPPKKHESIYKLYSLFVGIVLMFLGTLSVFVEIFCIQDFNILMMQISYSVQIVDIVIKTIYLYTIRNTLLKAYGYLSKLDKCAEENPPDRKRMEQIVRNSIRFYRYTMNACMTCWIVHVLEAILNRNMILEGWFPFDWRSSTPLYIVAISYQMFCTLSFMLSLISVNSYMILCIYIFIGHTKCLARGISNIGYANGRIQCNAEENYQELVRCINYYQNTQRYLNCLRSLISGSFLIQIMGNVIISSTIISAIVLSDDFGFLLKSSSYIVLIMLQLLAICYLVSHMTEESCQLTAAIYSCNWMDQDVKFRKAIILFMQCSQQPNEIVAGNMINISLPTFLSLIKMSYSLFTLFSST